MNNFFQPANTINLPAPKDLASGEGFFLGKIFGFATIAAKTGATVPTIVEGGVVVKRAVGFSPTPGAIAVFDAASQTIISGAGTTVGYVIGPSPDDATKSIVKLIPTFV